MGAFHDLYLTPAGRQPARPPQRIHTGRRRRGPDLRRPGGTMKGDFSRLTFDPRQAVHPRAACSRGACSSTRTGTSRRPSSCTTCERLAADLIGPFGGAGSEPRASESRSSSATASRPRCRSARGATTWTACSATRRTSVYSGQPSLPDQGKLPQAPFLVYLDVWERHVTYLQDGAIREVALEGADTTTRAQVVWRVTDGPRLPAGNDANLGRRTRSGRAVAGLEEDLAAAGQRPPPGPGEAGRGRHRSLHRLARGELPRHGEPALPGGGPGLGRGGRRWLTFKWSRDNGSVVFAVEESRRGASLPWRAWGGTTPPGCGRGTGWRSWTTIPSARGSRGRSGR